MDSSTVATIRSWVGSKPGLDDLELRYARLEDANQVALEVLRERRADFEGNYAEFAAEGDARWNATKNIEALDKRISQLEVLCGTGSAVLTTGHLVRGAGR